MRRCLFLFDSIWIFLDRRARCATLRFRVSSLRRSLQEEKNRNESTVSFLSCENRAPWSPSSSRKERKQKKSKEKEMSTGLSCVPDRLLFPNCEAETTRAKLSSKPVPNNRGFTCPYIIFIKVIRTDWGFMFFLFHSMAFARDAQHRTKEKLKRNKNRKSNPSKSADARKENRKNSP